MKKITDIFAHKSQTFSLELFPPKTQGGYEKLLTTLQDLASLQPDFISCTYGAGGGNRDKTLEIVRHIQQSHQIPGLAHLTCVLHTKEEIHTILQTFQTSGIENVLALRGDPPQDHPDWQPGPENFRYSSELCAFIRKHFGPTFSVGVAGFPQGHVLCPDKDLDASYLKVKMDNGADFIITQFFFDNNDYKTYVERLGRLGVNARVIPGILPITHYPNLVRFAALCGATIPARVKEIFTPIQDDPQKTLEQGTALAIAQCRELLAQGAPGLHFYCLNKVEPTKTIWESVRPTS